MTDRSTEPPAKGDEDGICPECRGSGLVEGNPCPRCDGTGRLVEGIGG
jgi:DnaJ-class molecular chaperone